MSTATLMRGPAARAAIGVKSNATLKAWCNRRGVRRAKCCGAKTRNGKPQKKLAALALAILIGLPHRFSFEIPESGKARRRLLRNQVAALTVRDYAG